MEVERNDLIRFDSLKVHKEWLIDEEQENLEPQPECCIYRVPKALRKANEEAYTPQVISIGPLHYGQKELAYMEKQKIRFRREFSKRITPEIWQEMVGFLQHHEQHIHHCYEETSNLKKLEFITMILYDAVFIIGLFLRSFEWRIRIRSLPPYKPLLRTTIRYDLLLLENQLPYFVLEELYEIAFPNNTNNPSLLILSCQYFRDALFNEDNILNLSNFEAEVKHFTDLKRHLLTYTYLRPQSRGVTPDLPCAIKLQESEVKFKQHVQGKCLIDTNFDKKKKLGIPFSWLKLKVHELQIPPINIYDQTESVFRNLMALEQCHYPHETLVCNYINLVDALINNEEDVNLLVEAGIISIHGGNNAKVENLFNKLGDYILLDRSCYCDIFRDLKAHYDNPWNHAMATLKRVYFNNLWRSTGTVAAILLLVLTLVQAICSILQVV